MVRSMQQGHYWSYLRAEPFCPGFAVDFLFGGTARISDFLPRHISPTKIRHFGEALFRGGFFTRPIFHIGRLRKRSLVFGGLSDFGKYYCGRGWVRIVGMGLISDLEIRVKVALCDGVREGLAKSTCQMPILSCITAVG